MSCLTLDSRLCSGSAEMSVLLPHLMPPGISLCTLPAQAGKTQQAHISGMFPFVALSFPGFFWAFFPPQAPLRCLPSVSLPVCPSSCPQALTLTERPRPRPLCLWDSLRLRILSFNSQISSSRQLFLAFHASNSSLKYYSVQSSY